MLKGTNHAVSVPGPQAPDSQRHRCAPALEGCASGLPGAVMGDLALAGTRITGLSSLSRLPELYIPDIIRLRAR